MAILENFENWFELEDNQCLATKIFSETVCQNCSEKESTNMPNTDNMGRNKSMYYQG
jgi:hypothetical protein